MLRKVCVSMYIPALWSQRPSSRAFLDDLNRAGQSKRVLVLVFSEFGRRLAENASAGDRSIISVGKLGAIGPDEICPRRRWPTGQVSRIGASG